MLRAETVSFARHLLAAALALPVSAVFSPSHMETEAGAFGARLGAIVRQIHSAVAPLPPPPVPVAPRELAPEEGVAEAFIAAVSFARQHPILRRAAQNEPAPIADSVELLTMGSAFIANYIHGDQPGAPPQQVRWVADVFARLFFTYVSAPPTDPDFGDDANLRRFAHEVLTPMVERAVN